MNNYTDTNSRTPDVELTDEMWSLKYDTEEIYR